MDTSIKTYQTLRTHGMVMIVMLILQYILGMLSNLFVQFPQSEYGGQQWEFAWSQGFVASHIVLGILLLIVGAVLWIRALRKKNRLWSVASGVGLICIIIAGSSGAQFISTQNNLYSFIMSLGFLGAFISYAWGFYAAKA